MSEVDNHYAIMASSEHLDKVVLEFRQEVKGLDVDIDNKFGLTIALSELEGIANYLRKKKADIAENQP